MKTRDLIAEAISLPVEERAIVVDSIIRSLNPPESDIDKKWSEVAKRRLEELRSGQVKPFLEMRFLRRSGSVFQNDIFIVAVMHLHRKPEYWKHRID